MTARRVLLAAHWLIVLTAAMTACVAVPLPFTGPFAFAVGVLAAAGIGLIGRAAAPHPKGHRS